MDDRGDTIALLVLRTGELKMLSGNKYTSRSSLGSTIYQCLQQIPKEDYLSSFRDWVKRLQKCVSVKGNALKVCNKNIFDKM